MPNAAARWISLGLIACIAAIVVALVWDRFQTDRPALVAPASAEVLPTSLAAPGTGTSQPEDLFKIFASAEPMQPAQYEIKDLQKIYPEFQHQPFDQAGFDEVMLPFAYSDPKHAGDPNEALALDALMSYDLDWSPGCYCARHAFFVFQHDPARIQALQQGYAPEQIASLINFWKATHAIGGELTRTPAGYEGKLEIFSADGKQVFTRSYDRPRSYWDLLGDMDVDAMTFLDLAPSDQLADYLHQARCEHPQSLIDLGSTAFMTETSPGAFDVYKKILDADPVFAMVRTWYANQKFVRDRNYHSEAEQLGIALSSRVDAPALRNFIPKYCPDQELASQYSYWLNSAAAMSSEDSPLIVECRLAKGYYGSQNLQSIVDHGLNAAAKYPNSHLLVREVGRSANDDWMSASLLTSCLLDHYLSSSSDKAATQFDLAYFCAETGRDDITMELLSEEGPRQPQNNLYLLLESLCRGGRYAEAADYYQLLSPRFDPTTSKWMAPYAAFAAAVTGRKELLDKILKDQHEVLALENLDGVFQAYRSAMDGAPIDPQQYLGIGRSLSFPMMWNLLLIAYCDARQGSSQHHRFMTEGSYQWPVNRLILIAQDDYQRRDPSRDAAAFYDYLAWLFGDDPWVVKAVSDYHQRGGADPTIDETTLRADLHQGLIDGQYRVQLGTLDWNHVLTPWRVAACVHQLLKQNKIKDAADIAEMYRDFESMGIYNASRRDVALELLHKVTQWGKSN